MEALTVIEELGKSYPVLNYLVPMVVAAVMTQRELKKRHERADRQRAEDVAYRAAHEVADMAHRKATIESMDTLSATVKKLSETLRDTQQIQLEFQRDTNEKFLKLGERMLFIEGQLQSIPYAKYEEMNRLAQKVRDESIGKIPDLTATPPQVDSKPQGDKDGI